MSTITLDILTPTYNHEKYIAECIEGVLSQKTNFKFRQLIGEDASTDRTRQIIQSYADKYPDIIIPYFRPQNVGAHKNSRMLFAERSAKYITILEGDDFWTDPNKIQKQIDFLEQNPDIIVAGHAVGELNDNTGEIVREIRAPESRYSLKEYLRRNVLPTCSAVFRNHETLNHFPDWYLKVKHADRALFTLLAEKGDIYMFPEVMGVYRVHDKGMFSGQSFMNTKSSSLEYLEAYEPYAPENVRDVIHQTKSGYASTIARIYYDENNTKEFKKYYLYSLKEWMKAPSFKYNPPQVKWIVKFLLSLAK